MDLPVMPPVSPMLAKLVSGMPSQEGLYFEPKWDGFRCIAFHDSNGNDGELILGSRNERPLTRYFPEVVESLRASLPQRCVVDGEIILAVDDELEFDVLQQRIHPAVSRVEKLSRETPAVFVAFDILSLGNDELRTQPFSKRREILEAELGGCAPHVLLTPTTTDARVASTWLETFEGAGLDGIIAKPGDVGYLENKRAMFKIKHERTADCVIAGFRWHKTGNVVGSMLLGLYDDEGHLHHVGVTASFTMAKRAELVDLLKPYLLESIGGHPWEAWGGVVAEGDGSGADATRRPGAPSRWNAKKDLSWIPLAPALVCEVTYGQMQGGRFRHATTFRRWRTDRNPESCNYSQLEVPTPATLTDIFDA